MNYKVVLFVCISVFAFNSSYAQKYVSLERKVEQAFKVDPEQCELQLFNKYGMINILPWAKDSIKVEVSLKARSNTDEKVQLMMNSFEIEFNNTGYFVMAKTVYQNNRESFMNDVNEMAKSIFGTGSSIEINYTVYMPVQANLKVENKFGNVYITQLTGKSSIKVSNGDLKASSLMGASNIEIKFGNATINKMTSATMLIDYSTIDLNEATVIKLTSKSSQINIDKILQLDIDSKRDRCRFNSVDFLKGTVSFSNITIAKITRDLNLVAKYTTINIDEISELFRNVTLTTTYSDINVSFAKSSDYKVDAVYSKNTTVVFPDNGKLETPRLIDEKEFAVSGTIGNPTALAMLKLNARYGRIVFQTK